MRYLSISSTEVLAALQCPVCGASLRLSEPGKSLLCTGGKTHCFDIARKGYVNLCPGRPSGGDSAEAVRARTAFLEKEYYRPFAEAVCHTLAHVLSEGMVVDAGCGEGYYTNRVAQTAGFSCLGFDLSRAAVEKAASNATAQNLRAAYAVAGLYALPVRDAGVPAVMNLFAPCAENEFCRVLRPGGILLVAGAGENHLYSMKKTIYDTPYKNEPRRDLPRHMERISHQTLRYELRLENVADRYNLFSMTPYFYRTSKEDANKLALPDVLVTEAEFDIDVFRKPL